MLKTIMKTMLIIIIITLPMSIAGMTLLYQLGEIGTRGTEVMAMPPANTRVTCAGACHTVTGCLGFNWMRSDPRCQLLSSLREVVTDTDCDLYVPDRLRRSYKELNFICPSCSIGNPPLAVDYWLHRCEPHGMIMGLLNDDDYPYDLDVLICAHLEGLTLELDNGYTCTNDNKNCSSLSTPNTIPDSVWCDHDWYSSPDNFRMACRKITSQHQIDKERCLSMNQTHGYLQGPATSEWYFEDPMWFFQCPPHMVVQRIVFRDSVQTEVDCCLIY